MTTLCPKCRHIRPADTSAPAWQCPACGVAYAKAAGAAAPAPVERAAGRRQATAAHAGGGLPWRAALTVLAIVASLYGGRQAYLDSRGPGGGSMDAGSIRQLAASVRAEQVVMYSTTECGYCTQARDWLQGHGFAFTECNMSLDSRCVQQFEALGATGTPYLIVRGPRGEQHMKEGFDSDAFLAALSG